MADVSYTRVNWAAYPSTTTKTSATNFNVMDKGIKDCADAVNTLNHANKIINCATGRSTAAKVVTLTGFTLGEGAKVTVRFTSTGSSNPSSGNLTLNVNNTGAKTIVDGHTNKTVLTYSSADLFYNNQVAEFVYDGTYWVYMNRDTNTTYTGATITTSTSKTGSGTTVRNTIASGTSLDSVVGTLLDNDYKINNELFNTRTVTVTTRASDGTFELDTVDGETAKFVLSNTPFYMAIMVTPNYQNKIRGVICTYDGTDKLFKGVSTAVDVSITIYS